jgi:hypothetical protein
MRLLSEAPAWVDWERVARGQRFYLANAAAVGMVLFNLSLVGGYSAPKINRVLSGTGYLRSSLSSTYRRLAETGVMIFDCMNGGPASLRPSGRGFRSAIRVRFLHARVRAHLTRSAVKYSIERDGVPINQEDLQVTQLAFSCKLRRPCPPLPPPPAPFVRARVRVGRAARFLKQACALSARPPPPTRQSPIK